MREDLLAKLKKQHNFEDWRETNKLAQNLFVFKFQLTGSEIPDWNVRKIQKLEAPFPSTAKPEEDGGSNLLVRSLWRRRETQIESGLTMHEVAPPPAEETSRALAPGGSRPVCTQSFWERSEGNVDTLLNVNTFECSSRALAHEYLLVLLGEFQSPLITRREDLAIGDVVFAGSEDFLLMFTRANLIYVVRNAGRNIVRVNEVADQLDKDVTAEPKKAELEGFRVARKGRAAARPPRIETKVGKKASLRLDALTTPVAGVQPLTEARRLSEVREVRTEPQLMYKIFSDKSVEVVSEQGQLMLLPQKKGEKEVTVYALDPARNAVATKVQLVAS